MPPDLLEEKLGQLENLNTEKDRQQEFLINLVMPDNILNKISIFRYRTIIKK